MFRREINVSLTMKQKINWGIIGPGKIARKFAYDLQFSSGGSLYAIASRSRARLDQFHREFPAYKQYDQYELMLADPDVDAVYIATPHSHHYPWILQCLEYGKHVLCEKPLCINAAQVREVMKKQQETGLFVMEALWTKFLPGYTALQEDLENHDEPILSMSADFCYYSARGEVARVYDPSLAGGSLLDIGIYPLFLALDLMGNPLDFMISGWVDQGADVRLSALLNYDHGRSAMIYSDVQSMSRMDAVIRLEDRVYVIPHQWHRMDQFQVIIGQQVTHHQYSKIGWGYFHEIEHVHSCLEKGLAESPVYPLENTLNLTRYMDAFRDKLNLKYPESVEKI